MFCSCRIYLSKSTLSGCCDLAWTFYRWIFAVWTHHVRSRIGQLGVGVRLVQTA